MINKRMREIAQELELVLDKINNVEENSEEHKILKARLAGLNAEYTKLERLQQ